MTHPAQTARDHIMIALEVCQADPGFEDTLEILAKNLARAQGKLFPASKLEKEAPAAQDMIRGAMEYLAQSLKILQDMNGNAAAGKAADSIATALKVLHAAVKKNSNTKKQRRTMSTSPPLAVNVNTMLNIHTDHYFYNGFSENIEDGGIFIATFDPKPVNAKVVVNFKLPGGHRVTARGVVHFVKEYNALNPETPPGMGVKFTDLLKEDKKAIERFLKKRAPVFYDDGR
jgi:uncharacterized protein (TIGR02266 family)